MAEVFSGVTCATQGSELEPVVFRSAIQRLLQKVCVPIRGCLRPSQQDCLIRYEYNKEAPFEQGAKKCYRSL